jgi:two-component system CheB/CheR fusion protein
MAQHATTDPAKDPPNDLSLEQLIERLALDRGPDLRGYKPTTLERRIRRRMFQINIGTFDEYLQRIQTDRNESLELLNTVLINVTEFFRDPPAWEMLSLEVLPRLLKNVPPGGSFRAWSAGCASGEEAYSLAILIAELLGPALPEYDVKVYATDIDDDALNVARRGEYPADKLRRIKSSLREKYFTAQGSQLRVARDLRRTVIFGRSNILSDAPISHCHFVMCRNVLIYFDTDTQRQVLARLHYALEPGGILFLGKAESKLNESKKFRPLNVRWRIFQKPGPQVEQPAEFEMCPSNQPEESLDGRSRLAAYQRHILDTVKSAVILADTHDVVLAHNQPAVSIWGLGAAKLNGRRLQNTDLVVRCPELLARLETVRADNSEPLQFACQLKGGGPGDERHVSITLRPMISEGKQRLGTLIYAEDVTTHQKLNSTIEQLETTSEELQSANEELETTNEELHSSNEELETTNEELQSTNEELETTNEELQSLNEELENMNEELEHRTQELHSVNQRYAETLQSMPWPVVLVDSEENIQLWNAAAQQLFGVGATSVVGVGLDGLPIASEARKALVRRFRAVMLKPRPSMMRFEGLRIDHKVATFNVHFTPVLGADSKVDGVLIMFGPEADGIRTMSAPLRPRSAAKPKSSTKAKSKK